MIVDLKGKKYKAAYYCGDDPSHVEHGKSRLVLYDKLDLEYVDVDVEPFLEIQFNDCKELQTLIKHLLTLNYSNSCSRISEEKVIQHYEIWRNKYKTENEKI